MRIASLETFRVPPRWLLRRRGAGARGGSRGHQWRNPIWRQRDGALAEW